MSPTRAVLFDIGGTLFRYDGNDPAAGEARLRQMAELFGHDDPEHVYAVVQAALGRASREYFVRPFYLHRDWLVTAARYAAEEVGIPFRPELVTAAGMAMVGRNFGGAVVREGVPETLEELRRRGIHVGAVSNSDEDQFERMLGGLGVQHLFDSLLCSETAQSCKPDPGIFHEALRRAGCKPHEALFVGDTPDHDIAGAEAVGMRTVLIAEDSKLGFERGTARPGQLTIREIPEVLALL